MRRVKEILRSLRDRALRLLPEQLSVREQGIVGLTERGVYEIAYRKGAADEAIIGQLFEQGKYRDVLEELARSPDATVLDVWAHIGCFCLAASERVPVGRVLAVEPTEESFNLLRINLALNDIENVAPTRVALSDRDGKVDLYYNPHGN